MEPVSLPTSGRIYLDASAFIYSIERHPQFAALLDPLWAALVSGNAELLTSELTILESLVLPIRSHDQKSSDAFEKAFDESGLQLLPANRAVMRLAAEIRASRPSLRTPDAIHLATAEIYAAQFVVTNDRRMKGNAAFQIIVLADLLTNPH